MIRQNGKTHKPTQLERDATDIAQSLTYIFPSHNRAADACGISRARFSHIFNANYAEVAITTTDLRVMEVIFKNRTMRGEMGEPLRELMDEFEAKLYEANNANRELARLARRISRMIERL